MNESSRANLLKASQVADLLAVPVRAVYVFVERGELAAYRLNRRLRFAPADIQGFLDQRHESRQVSP